MISKVVIPAEEDHWAKQMVEWLKVWPKLPYQCVPYNVKYGIAWLLIDGDGRHVGMIHDEAVADIIVQRLNQ